MNPETLLYHLHELSVMVGLSPDLAHLDLDAPQGVLTPELLDLIREHRDALIDLVFSSIERDAIQEEAQSEAKIKYTGDEKLIPFISRLPKVKALESFFLKRGGAVFEVRAA